MAEEGLAVRLSGGEEETGAALCFENPVNHDLVGGDGRKLAGAGQRRSKAGLLHQGSVAAAAEDDGASARRAARLAARLAGVWEPWNSLPDEEDLQARCAARYETRHWRERR